MTRTVREFCEAAFSHVGLDWERYVVVDPEFFRPVDRQAPVGDASKAREQLGWEPKTSFEDLVAMMVDARSVAAAIAGRARAMTAYVHPTAVVGDNFKPAPFTVIDDDVRIGDNVITGPGVHIRHGAVIGDNVLIGDHVTIHDEAHIGSNSVIADGAVIGRQPMEMPGEPRRTERLPGARIGERCRSGRRRNGWPSSPPSIVSLARRL